MGTVARECGDDDVTAGRGPGQRGWYHWACRFVNDASVLDAGCGLGYGLDILEQTAARVTGQDLDPRLSGPRVRIGELTDWPAKCVDVVISVDVIEHIVDDRAFVASLVRIARQRVILTTPNWTAGRCKWPYHVREYTPAQLRALCERFGSAQLWKGTPDGFTTYPINHPRLNHLFNTARAVPGLGHLTSALNLLMPDRLKIHSHLAAVLDLPPV